MRGAARGWRYEGRITNFFHFCIESGGPLARLLVSTDMLHPLKKLLLVAGLCALPFTASQAFVDISINIAPPILPVYEQPLCPVDGYLWTPGYWGYADAGYYWVPGVWVEPPRIGFLWTPGYWGYGDGLYAFHSGYWGPTVGFYGGVNYGFGYGGYGYGGGEWRGNRFAYNTAITRVNTTVIHNTYVNRTVINNRVTSARTSFNGGPNGINARPNAEQRQAMNAPHLNATSTQVERRQEASQNRAQFASVNHGHPTTLARGEGARSGLPHEAPGSGGEVVNHRPPLAPGSGGERVNGGLPHEAPGSGGERVNRAATRGDGLTPQERQLATRREIQPRQNAYQDRRSGEERGYTGSQQARSYAADGRTPSRNAYAAQRRGEARQVQRQAVGQRQAQPPHGDQRRAQPKPAQGHGDGRKEKRDDRE